MFEIRVGLDEVRELASEIAVKYDKTSLIIGVYATFIETHQAHATILHSTSPSFPLCLFGNSADHLVCASRLSDHSSGHRWLE